jgi:hypothetical protein
LQHQYICNKVLEALTSPDVLNKIIPVLSEKIGETISTLIESEIQACVETHINPLKDHSDHRQNSDAVFVVKFVFEWLAKYQGCLDLTFY